MKIHRVLVEAVIQSLEHIFIEGRQADKVIERVLKQNPKWGSRDRAFIAEYTYEMVRWWRLINEVAGNGSNKTNRGALWQAMGVWMVLKGTEVPAWSEFKNIHPAYIHKRREEVSSDIRIAQSIPDWLHELGTAQLGQSWEAEITALNKPADLIIRVNTLKTNREQLLRKFKEMEIKSEAVAETSDGVRLLKRVNLFTNPLFKEGWFEVQDASSQLVAQYLDVKPGMQVIDACAGAGGKTLHLSALMQSKGRITAMDTEGWKLEELKRRARRAGAQNIETRVAEETMIQRLAGTADRLLLDVPCSGLGVIKRNPDAKWKLQPDFMARITETQQHIIGEYSKMLKPGGYMVYATCSILPMENADQVQTFLSKNEQFELIREHSVSPAQTGFDGFYMALLKKVKK